MLARGERLGDGLEHAVGLALVPLDVGVVVTEQRLQLLGVHAGVPAGVLGARDARGGEGSVGLEAVAQEGRHELPVEDALLV